MLFDDSSYQELMDYITIRAATTMGLQFDKDVIAAFRKGRLRNSVFWILRQNGFSSKEIAFYFGMRHHHVRQCLSRFNTGGFKNYFTPRQRHELKELIDLETGVGRFRSEVERRHITAPLAPLMELAGQPVDLIGPEIRINSEARLTAIEQKLNKVVQLLNQLRPTQLIRQIDEMKTYALRVKKVEDDIKWLKLIE